MGCKEYSGFPYGLGVFFSFLGGYRGEERVRSATDNSSPSMKICINFF